MDNDKAQVLRYLGYRNQEITPEMDAMIDNCMSLMSETARPRHVRRTFKFSVGEAGITLETGFFLPGVDICRHLGGCNQVVLLAATLGISADNLIRFWENTDITKSLVLDACATQMIESCCDEIENEVRAEAADRSLNITTRFSPGYGDLPLDIQPGMLAVLDTGRKIGLTCTDSLIMLPRKSVTALIGIGKDNNGY